MARTPSTMLPLGTPAPAFSLPDPAGTVHRLEDFSDKSALLVMFICNHCPFVIHVQEELARLGLEYGPRNVGVLAISSNNVETHPDDSPDKMAEMAQSVGFNFPYLYDESQEVAKAYHAACTPDFYLFDGDMKLAYRGQIDDSRPGNGIPVTGRDMRAAIDAVLRGEQPAENQIPSLGCNIKWKAGNEPAYFG